MAIKEFFPMALNIRRKGDHRISADLFRGPEGCRRKILFFSGRFLFHLRGNSLESNLFVLWFDLVGGWSC